jgi:hypothetical protein
VFACSLPLAYSQITGGTRAPAVDLFAVSFVSLSLVPAATLVAITRYRLYEIDRIVNRTLVYGFLTAILAGVFTAGIAFAQRLFVAMTGERSDAAIVLTTLLVATLYAPVRKRLEVVVDRRFKYDRTRFGAYRAELAGFLSIVDPARAAQRLIGEAVRELAAIGGAVLDDDGSVVAAADTWPTQAAIRLPIPGHPGRLAVLVLGPRSDGQLHDPRAVTDLEELAGLVAAATDRDASARSVTDRLHA